ncbi:hypothetical protein, partial [Oryzihumus sp.]|uniref:hypothetical protein n=1 Tax=Oryzihumus sp. TaxID=1968903 RepID=UPI002ED8EABA
MHRLAKLSAFTAAVATSVALVGAAPAAFASDASTLPVMDPAGAEFTEAGGATPLATDKTVPHWNGSFTDPTNGVTYGYNMVGANPSTNSASTVATDIIPLNVVFSTNNGYALNGTDVVGRTVASPIFQAADYTSTDSASSTDAAAGYKGPGGQLSPGNT